MAPPQHWRCHHDRRPLALALALRWGGLGVPSRVPSHRQGALVLHAPNRSEYHPSKLHDWPLLLNSSGNETRYAFKSSSASRALLAAACFVADMLWIRGRHNEKSRVAQTEQGRVQVVAKVNESLKTHGSVPLTTAPTRRGKTRDGLVGRDDATHVQQHQPRHTSSSHRPPHVSQGEVSRVCLRQIIRSSAPSRPKLQELARCTPPRALRCDRKRSWSRCPHAYLAPLLTDEGQSTVGPKDGSHKTCLDERVLTEMKRPCVLQHACLGEWSSSARRRFRATTKPATSHRVRSNMSTRANEWDTACTVPPTSSDDTIPIAPGRQPGSTTEFEPTARAQLPSNRYNATACTMPPTNLTTQSRLHPAAKQLDNRVWAHSQSPIT